MTERDDTYESDDDLDPWREATADVRPLQRRERVPAPRRPARPSSVSEPDAAPEGGPAMNRRDWERLRRGRVPIDDRLDLHGFPRDRAERELSLFLASCRASDRRCVLVITGRGSSGEDAGVIRRSLPGWLTRSPNREIVLGSCEALPEHGGPGAFYVYLRRR